MNSVKNQSLRICRQSRSAPSPTTSQSTACSASTAATIASRWKAKSPTATESK